jgi:hypothetical protein
MTETIKPIERDPYCLDSERMPDEMKDPMRDFATVHTHAYRAAATILENHRRCPYRPCRAAKCCFAAAPHDSCASPSASGAEFALQEQLLAFWMWFRKHHDAWQCRGEPVRRNRRNFFDLRYGELHDALCPPEEDGPVNVG